MQKRLICPTILLSIFLLLNGCLAVSTTLNDYKPKSSDEEAIVSQLMKYEKAWNNGDVQGCVDILHDNAKMSYGASEMQARKSEYEKLLPYLMAEYPDFEFSKPNSINISGRSATVKLMLKFANKDLARSGSVLHTVDFFKADNQWMMIAWKY